MTKDSSPPTLWHRPAAIAKVLFVIHVAVSIVVSVVIVTTLWVLAWPVLRLIDRLTNPPR